MYTFCHLEFFVHSVSLYMCSYEGRKFAIKNLYLVVEFRERSRSQDADR